MIMSVDGFAGIFPEHKFEIVNRLHGVGNLGAMTGDVQMLPRPLPSRVLMWSLLCFGHRRIFLFVMSCSLSCFSCNEMELLFVAYFLCVIVKPTYFVNA